MADAELFTDARDTVAKRLGGIAPDRWGGDRTPSALIKGDDAETIAAEVAKPAGLRSGSIMGERHRATISSLSPGGQYNGGSILWGDGIVLWPAVRKR